MKLFGKPIWRGGNDSGNPRAIDADASRRYVFVSGHPRSGTNWVSSLLNLHPQAFCDGEFHFLILRWAMDGFTSLPWYLGGQEPVRSAAERGLHQLIRDCLAERCRQRRPGADLPPVLGDHTPRLFRLMIPPPEARYIVVTRDGRDVLVSYTFHLLNTRAPDVCPESIRPFFVEQLARCGSGPEAQREAAIALLGYEPWVRHYANFWSDHIWHDKRIFGAVAAQGFAPYVKFVSYEALRADIEGGRRSLYAHIGLDPALAAPVSPETNTAPGFGGREDVTSFYRKGEPGDWRRYFTPNLARWFDETAGKALIELGYERDSDWVVSVSARSGPELTESSGTRIAPGLPAVHSSGTPSASTSAAPPRVQVSAKTSTTLQTQ